MNIHISQVLVNTLTTAFVDGSLPAAATMYTRITEGISAIFATELICSGNCQKTVAAVVKFVTALGADAFEASLTETTSSATIPLELYQTEQRQMAEFMPRSGHPIHNATAGVPATAGGVYGSESTPRFQSFRMRSTKRSFFLLYCSRRKATYSIFACK